MGCTHSLLWWLSLSVTRACLYQDFLDWWSLLKSGDRELGSPWCHWGLMILLLLWLSVWRMVFLFSELELEVTGWGA